MMLLQMVVHDVTVGARELAENSAPCMGRVKRAPALGLESEYCKRCRAAAFLFFSISKLLDMEGSPEAVDVEGVMGERGS